MKKIYFPILLLIIMSCNQNQNSKTLEPWSVSQLLEPKLLSYKIETGKDLPKIISIRTRSCDKKFNWNWGM